MNEVVSRAEWLTARLHLLDEEKALTRQRERVASARRALPWVRVERLYTFEGPLGPVTLSDLFAGRTQLLVYHFMFPPEWSAGCPSCSFWADGYDAIVPHLAARDLTLVAVSRAAYPQIETFRRRMGWSFEWVSSAGSDFNRDFGVSFTEAEISAGTKIYNFGTQSFAASEAPGVSVFTKDADGRVYHTYSCYSRGLDALNPAYQLLDLAPKGRDEDGLPYPMAWVRRHDEY